MIALTQLWLPVLLSAAAVFIASSVMHMALKFWHMSDYRKLSNEEEVGAAIREGGAGPGMYMLPYCDMESMKKEGTKEKFERGPVGMLILRANGAPSIGASMGQWFAFCLAVSLFAGYLAAATLAAGSDASQVLRVTVTAAFLAFGFGALPAGIWWGQPWTSVGKHVVDGAIYALIVGALFAWLWP